MENNINVNYALDSQGARLERIIKRFFILTVVLAITLFITNGFWIYRELQFTSEVTTIEAEQHSDGDSNNYIVGGDYGNTEGQDN